MSESSTNPSSATPMDVEATVRDLDALANDNPSCAPVLRNVIRFLTDELGGLRQDAERLDWWNAHPAAVQSCLFNTDPTAGVGTQPLAPFRIAWGWRLSAAQSPTFTDVRAAIDAARSLTEPTEDSTNG